MFIKLYIHILQSTNLYRKHNILQLVRFAPGFIFLFISLTPHHGFDHEKYRKIITKKHKYIQQKRSNR